MSVLSPVSRSCASLSRRGVLIGLAASSLPAPAIVRVSSIMRVRRMLLAEIERPSACYAQRLLYNSLAYGLRQGRITIGLNGRIPSLSEAEPLVRYARQNGWITE